MIDLAVLKPIQRRAKYLLSLIFMFSSTNFAANCSISLGNMFSKWLGDHYKFKQPRSLDLDK